MVSLGFHRPFSITGRLVGLWTRSEWVHVGIEHSLGDCSVVTEATNFNGVVVRRSEYARYPDIRINLSWIPNDAATNYLSRFWGTKYGWRDVFGFVTGCNKNHGGVHCSELAALMIASSIPFAYEYEVTLPTYFENLKSLVLSRSASQISPADLAKACGLAA